MRVLVVDQNPEDACSWYRCSGPWSAIARTGKAEVVFSDRHPQWREIRGFDWLFVLRPHLDGNLQAIRDALWHGVRVWTDFDDNLFAIPPENPARLILGRPREQAIMKQAIELSDVVTVSTDELSKAFQKLAPKQKNFRVIRNAMDESFLRSRKEIGYPKEKVVLWRGTSTHMADLEMFREEIVSTAKKIPSVVWLFMGTEPWFSQEINCRILPPQPLFKYFQQLASIRAHVGIVPLQPIGFNECKSDIAALELSFAGAQCLVPYFWREIPGTCRYNSPKDFGERLREMLASSEINNNSTLKYFSEERSLLCANKERLSILEDFA